MKVIFLDVDGVLNCMSTRERIYGLVGIEDRLVKRLAQIVAFTGAEIWLVSSWKESWICGDELGTYIESKLAGYGIKISGMVDFFDVDHEKRGYQVMLWLDERLRDKDREDDIESFVILDDEWFDYSDWSPLKGRVVKTEFYDKNGGLKDLDVEQAVKILNVGWDKEHIKGWRT